MLKTLFIWLINFYQKAISPLMPARCRYYPTCSQYGKQALLWHGVQCGFSLMLKRVWRCHPWGGCGVDFVPLPLHKEMFFLAQKRHDCVHIAVFGYRQRLEHLLR